MHHALSAALLAPALFFSDTPSVGVEVGTKVTKTYENALKMELQSISIEFGDEEQEVPDEQLPEVTIEDNELVVFTDLPSQRQAGTAATEDPEQRQGHQHYSDQLHAQGVQIHRLTTKQADHNQHRDHQQILHQQYPQHILAKAAAQLLTILQ